jgi:hypothetical protein
MKRTFPAWSGFAMVLLVPMWLLSVPAAAQSHGSAGGSSGSSGSSGGGQATSSGGGGGTGTSHASSGGGTTTGTAVSRGDSGASNVSTISSGGSSVGSARSGSEGASLISGGSSGATRARAAYRGDPTTRAAGDPIPPYARPRDGRTITGTATERVGGVPGGRVGGPLFVPNGYYYGYDPYAFGGFGFAGFGGYGYGNYGYGSYGGFYDPWYDPFYGGFGGGYGSGYGYGGSSSQYSSSSQVEEGSLRLKIKPSDASVFVDGYYVGLVNQFDGIFHKLRIETGPHRVEVRAPGYETLTFEVRLVPDHTTTYTGELKKIQ